jgi:hypothetical protein
MFSVDGTPVTGNWLDYKGEFPYGERRCPGVGRFHYAFAQSEFL